MVERVSSPFIWALSCSFSSGISAFLHAHWHVELAASFNNPLPFVILSVGVAGWLLQARLPPKHLSSGVPDWQSRLAGKLESAGRVIVGMVRKRREQQLADRALHLLQMIYARAIEESKGNAPNVVARSEALSCLEARLEAGDAASAQLSVSGLAAKFESLTMQICPSTHEQVWASRSANAVADALAYIPDAPQAKVMVNPIRIESAWCATFLLLLSPVYAAASAPSTTSAAVFGLVAAVFPGQVVSLVLLDQFRSKRNLQLENEDVTLPRRRLFSLRMLELQSLLNRSPSKTGRNRVAIHLERVKRQGFVPTDSSSNKSIEHEDDDDRFEEIPKYTSVGESRAGGKEVIARAVPFTIGATVAQTARYRTESNFGSHPSTRMIEIDNAPAFASNSKRTDEQQNIAAPRMQVVDQPLTEESNPFEVVGELGMLGKDRQGCTASPLCDKSQNAQSSRVSTFSILSGSSVILDRQYEPTRQPKLSVTPERNSTNRSQTLPDVSQADVSLSFSLSPVAARSVKHESNQEPTTASSGAVGIQDKIFYENLHVLEGSTHTCSEKETSGFRPSGIVPPFNRPSPPMVRDAKKRAFC